MPHSPTAKQRTNVSIDADVLAAARAMKLNVSAISEAAVSAAVRQAQAESWAKENAQALADRRDWIANHGTALADLQVLKLD
ncbi:MAG: type II toxin-antitoxin system CcdA family antitoxin [Thalassovita sp.]